jgi:hypothetical protein
MHLTEEQILIQQAAKQLAHQVVRPQAKQWRNEKQFPHSAIKALSEAGFMGMLVDEKWGGSQTDYVSYALVIEQIAKADAALSTILAVHNSVGCMPIANFGSEYQKELFLKPLAQGNLLGAFCLTEPEAGSDAKNIQTKAEKHGDGYILNGVKQFVTSGKNADIAIVITKTGDAHNAFIVPTNTPGFTVAKCEKKMGQEASEIAQIVLENVKLGTEHLLGAEGQGYKIALNQLESGRIGIAAQALGMAQEALDLSLQYTHERKTFGKALHDHQAIQFRLADMDTQCQAARLLIWHAANLKDHQQPALKAASQAKLFASEKAVDICRMALELHGGYGYLQDYKVEQLLRDALVTPIYEGTSDVQRMIISRELIKNL